MQRADEERWMAQWRAAAVALDAQRRDELEALTPARALAAADTLLALASPQRLSLERRLGSGLVELQRRLHRRETT